MNRKLRKLVYAAMFAVVNYVAFAYGKINIPTSAGTSTAIHIANAVVVVSSFFLGPYYGGLAGAVGLSIADVFDPRYVASAPKTFLMKFMIGFIAGTVAEKMHLREKTERAEIVRTVAAASIAGLGFNVIFDPIIGYFYKRYLLGMSPQLTAIVQTWAAGSSAINAVICVFVSIALYLALYRQLNKLDQ